VALGAVAGSLLLATLVLEFSVLGRSAGALAAAAQLDRLHGPSAPASATVAARLLPTTGLAAPATRVGELPAAK